MKSWKTTFGGIGLIACQVAAVVWPQHADKLNQIGLLLAGGGLLAARDNNVTSEQAGAKKEAP